ncbi:hypothetical protein GGU10DRAFT_247934, partial [Lentinula aff. detonsa]
GIDLETKIRNQYGSDRFFKTILDRPKDYRNFEVLEGLIYLNLDDRKVLGIPDVVIQGRRARELVIDEAHSLLAHLGYSKTLAYLRDHVWWK